MGGAQVLIWRAIIFIAFSVPTAYSEIVFTSPPADVVIAEGMAARFDCSLTASSLPVSISWLKNGTIITPSSKYTFLLNNSLFINPTGVGDNVTYTCEVTNQLMSDVQQRSAALDFALFRESFIISPSTQTVDEGSHVNLFCLHAGSSPPATITWQQNNVQVVPSSRISIQTLALGHTNPTQVSSTLGIASVQSGDEGSYMCTARNSVLLESIVTSHAGILSIRGPPSPPSIVQNPTDSIVASVGQFTTFSCSVVGEPSPAISWTNNNISLILSFRVTIETSDGVSMLVINSVQPSDYGMYRCVAANSQGSATSQAASLQLAFISANFELQPSDTVAIINSSVILDCRPPLSAPVANISWSKSFAQISDPRYQILMNGSLLIADVILGDQAVYHCTATNPVLGMAHTSEPAQLTTIGVPVITPDTIVMVSGGSATFSCSAQGTPPPQITWYRGTNQLTTTTSPSVTITGMSITISSLSLSDEDYYTCGAVFPSGQTEAEAFLNIIIAPIFQEVNTMVTAVSQGPVTLPCNVHFDPTIIFSWRFSGETIVVDAQSSYGLLENGSLVILNVVQANEGTYVCMATNSLGTAQGNVVLDVQTLPLISAISPVLSISLGSTATLGCSSSGDPIPTQSWSFNGSPLMTSGRIQISNDGRLLTVQNVEYEDEGVYTCQASSPTGVDSDTVTLDVQVSPVVVTTPPNQQLLAGSTAIFSCSVTGDPIPSVRWLTSQSIDVLAAGNPRMQVLANWSLVISDVRLEDSQQYVCEAVNSVGSGVGLVSLTVLVAPSVFLPVETTSIQGNSLILDCNVIGQPPPTIVWFRDGIQLELSVRIQTDNEGRLLFTNTLSSDAVSYRCEATNEIDVATASTNLSVLVAPIIHSLTGMVTVVEALTVALDCNTSGTPQPSVFWFRDGVLLPNPNIPRIQQAPNDSLVIVGVVKGDEGSYICQARNEVGTEFATILLRVLTAPALSAIDSSITAIQGSTVTMSCTATGDPVPVQTWTRNGVEVPGIGTTNRFLLESNGSVLIVQNVSEADEGEFRCHGSSIAGVAFDSVTINVIVPPFFNQLSTDSIAVENTTHSLTCLADGDPAPSITWSISNTTLFMRATLLFTSITRSDAGLYTCTASNSAGTVSRAVNLDVQYQPSILQLTGSMSIHLNSDAQLLCVADSNPTADVSWIFGGDVIARGDTLVLSSVTAASQGLYTCSASNSLGVASGTLTITVLFPPSAPTITSVQAISSSVLTVEWVGSTDDGGSPITDYVVEYRAGSGPFMSVLVDENTRSMTLIELPPFTMFNVRVRAMNIVDRSDPSETRTVQTHSDAPSIPANFRIDSFTSSSLSLAWNTPDPLNGMLAAYELRNGEDDDFETTQRETLVFRRQFTILGLSVGVVYRVQVRGGTVSMTGELLWGLFTILRVQDGVVLNMTTEQPTTLPTEASTAPPTETSTAPPTEASTAPPTEASTAPPTATPTNVFTAPPTTSSIETPTGSQPPQTTQIPLNPPTVVPSLVTALIPPGSQGQILVYWREPSSGLDTFEGYSITLSPAPPPSVDHPILVPRTSISGTHIIDGLGHFVTYIVTVATYNQDGVGPVSATDSVTTPESEPTAPREVRVDILTQQLIIVSWLPPDPANGLILNYTVRVMVELTGELLISNTLISEVVNVAGLNLDNVRYQVCVSARTSVGSGPVVCIGIGSVILTTSTSPPSTTFTSPPSTTVTSPPSTTFTSPPSTTFTSSPSTTSTLTETPSATPVIQSTTPITPPTIIMDTVYYVVRIVPVVVFVLFVVVIVAVTSLFCLHSWWVSVMRRKGAYQFSNLDNNQEDGGEHKMTQNLTLDGEAVVASDDLTTSAYYVKDAFDSNFTYSPPPTTQSSEDDINEPDIGIDLHREQDQHEQLTVPSSPIGRDAMQESTSRPESEEISPLAISKKGTNPRPVYHPGDFSYADLDSIRAKKSQDLAKRFDKNKTTPTPDTSRVITFDPNLGLSSGGIMETRIGAIGQENKFPTPMETSAQLY